MRALTKQELMSEITVFWTNAEKYNAGMNPVEVQNLMKEIKLYLQQNEREVMGTSEVAERLGWSKQHVISYQNRAKAKGFPAGMLPKPFQRIASGWLWYASDIEEYAKSREVSE